jgi:hypothetical protein
LGSEASDRPESEIAEDGGSEPEFARGSRLHWWLIVLGPALLAVDIVLSLWVSYLHVTHSVNVYVDTELEPGARFAVRTRMLDARREGIEDARGTAWFVDSEGTRFDLGDLGAIGKRGVSQAVFGVPRGVLGTGELVVEVSGDVARVGPITQTERIPIELVAQRGERDAVHTFVESSLQWGDDTDPQPESLRIDLQPFGRLLAGFVNQFLVRVTDLDGKPLAGKVVVRLIQGELGGEVGPGLFGDRPPPVVHDGRADGQGLTLFGGMVGTDVLRFEIAVTPDAPVESKKEPPPTGPPAAESPPSPPSSGDAGDPPGEDDEAKPITRRFRLVSRVGGVRLHVDSLASRPGATVEIGATALRSGRPVYVDVHGPDGAWIDTLRPPLMPGDPDREYELPLGIGEGFVHFEGYMATNAPGTSAAVGRVAVADRSERSAEALRFLVDAQRERLDLPRVIEGFEKERERAYLDRLSALDPGGLDDESWRRVRRWLVGSLPSEVWGPPHALSSRAREDAALAAFKQRWTVGLRIFLWGGGALLVLLAAGSLRAQQRRVNAAAAEALEGFEGGGAEFSMIERRGEMLTRAAGVIGLLVSMLVLTALMLERLVWEF